MSKNRISKQTIAIIVLIILLIFTISFGGVYAYYSSTTTKVNGRITMANLNINLDGTHTDTAGNYSILFKTNGYVYPGQTLENTPLIITNRSNTEIYLAVAYSVNADDVNVDKSDPLIEIRENNGDWYDYLYTAKDSNNEIKVDSENNPIQYRCLISKVVPPCSNDVGDIITVIGENCLKLPITWDNELQNKTVTFSFQAFAIGANLDEFDFDKTTPQDDAKSEKIMQTIYKAFDYNFSI